MITVSVEIAGWDEDGVHILSRITREVCEQDDCHRVMHEMAEEAAQELSEI